MKKSIKNILLIALVILISGCSLKDINPTKQANIDNSLPVVKAESIRYIANINSIAFEWVGFTGHNIQGYHLYRANVTDNSKKLTRVATIDNKFATHYLDTKLSPETDYLYAFSTVSNKGTESLPSNVKTIRTLNLLDSVSLINAIDGLPRQVKLVWRPHSNNAINSYIVQRSETKKQKWKSITTVKHRLNAEYIDLKLKDNTDYLYRIISVSFDGIESKPSQIVEATTKQLPSSVRNISASTNLPQKIILRWNPSENKEIIGYNIYVSNSEDGYYSKVATTASNANNFQNIIKENGKLQHYKITSVDKDNLETNVKKVKVTTGKTLGVPFTPTVTLAQINNNTVILNWVAADDRPVTYNIYKTNKVDFFNKKVKIFKNLKTLRFEDSDIKRGLPYTYEIEAVDQFGLSSKKTTPAKLQISEEQE
jgi:fibronectin type 3 domain-containing protein